MPEDRTEIKLPRIPLAWGATVWGPVPGTSRIYFTWDGPGSGIYAYVGDPQTQGPIGHRVQHPAADGTYGTLKEAQKAVDAFVEIGRASWTSGAFD
jgi:hypothetical protein